ncbi:unnamed protein product, partial [Discosporangium mesarthrocarpum]
MNVVQEIRRINERELETGVTGKASWHYEFRDSAWVFVGGLAYDLTEGDVLCVMSQWGEIEDINLPRDKDTGKPRGYCFLKYEDTRSTILAVDNFNGIELLGRTLRVDHKHKYSLPKEVREREEKLEEERVARGEAPSASGPSYRPGMAYEGKKLASEHTIHKGVDVFGKPAEDSDSSYDQFGVDGVRPGQGPGALLSSPSKKMKRKKNRDKEGGESKEAKKARKEAKKAKKEAKKVLKGAKEDREEGVLQQEKGEDRQQETQVSRGSTTSPVNGSKSESTWPSRGRHIDTRENGGKSGGREAGQGGTAEAADVWERGARPDGREEGGRWGKAFGVLGSHGADPPPPPATSSAGGSVMDWRGTAAQGGNWRGEKG